MELKWIEVVLKVVGGTGGLVEECSRAELRVDRVGNSSLEGGGDASSPVAPKEESVFVAAAYAREKEVVNGVPMI